MHFLTKTLKNRFLRRAFVFALTGTVMVSAQTAIAAPCNFSKGPLKIEFEELRKKTSYDHSKNGTEIAAISKQHKSTSELKNHKVRGFTFYRLHSGLKLTFSGKKYADKTHCLYIKDAAFRVGYKKMDVLIDRKYSKNSCAYKAILDHENTHVRINNDILSNYLPTLKAEFKRAVERMPIRKSYNPDATTVRMRDELLARMNKAVDDLSKSLRKAHAKIDTADSYRQVRNSCQNW
jgi:hypothetical protein